ncbi:MAG TPA: SufD family Fe-S cluster assembly protein [Syntrophales bacterium]|jgi:Fe-S cluster assembly scaffold protein SufB|nr:SufD family Fe-S cluster assembly protein [Syntrophales bacterium]HON22987.1 SufD family Fe-S cluster assembly protein [Syntrophales bacterium]HOU77471.1 SufD family Fe-S cluster assembly protein [Syntrophales bacterium]HPC31809.1 SufD family Fe-S cluster assembly protein [Syntrophales bacterium]HQI34644.1 SufD family Fe-S cluster assembly protein [Syntrophales bacterium]
MLDAIDRELLKTVADLEGLPKGAFNIRKNGRLLKREVSANINIESLADGKGITVTIKPGTVNESVHIPVILSQAGLYDVVYNNFLIGAGSDVTIIAGCGIHCGGPEPEGHAGIHEFHVGEGAKVKYVEKHYARGSGRGRRSLNPTTKVILAAGAAAEMELTQIGGVDEANRVNEATLGPDSLLLITERVLTEGGQRAVSTNTITMAGEGSRANMISRSVIKGDSRQDFHATLEALAPCFGHIECDAIIMDNGKNETIPALKAHHPDAALTHEASIGKIASDQLMKLMSLGLDYDEAVNRIIQGFLK